MGADQAGNPGIGRRGRRMELDRGEAEGAIDWPGGHVDELHAPIGHHRNVAEHEAPNHDQVILSLGVTP